MKFKMVEDLESLLIEKGDGNTQEDIDNFIRFIWTQAEKRGLMVKFREDNNEGRKVGRNRESNVQSNGMEERD
jgi:hypothetical protein|tara:strand:- start:2518 stop:2736 length:219 start_codon:yes stop_codon:yes gene_type:complete